MSGSERWNDKKRRVPHVRLLLANMGCNDLYVYDGVALGGARVPFAVNRHSGNAL
jgi:hypothetical protein